MKKSIEFEETQNVWIGKFFAMDGPTDLDVTMVFDSLENAVKYLWQWMAWQKKAAKKKRGD